MHILSLPSPSVFKTTTTEHTNEASLRIGGKPRCANKKFRNFVSSENNIGYQIRSNNSSSSYSYRVKEKRRSWRSLSAEQDGNVAAAMDTIRELDKDTFYPFLREEAGSSLVVVDFYTDWCGPCKLIYPELLILQKKLATEDVLFVKLNCNKENKELGKELKIKVAPTFQLYRNGEKLTEMTGAKIDLLRLLIKKNLQNKES